MGPLGSGERLLMVMPLEDVFPGLRGTAYRTSSPADRIYNCIAWAVGVTADWWWPHPAERAEAGTAPGLGHRTISHDTTILRRSRRISSVVPRKGKGDETVATGGVAGASDQVRPAEAETRVGPRLRARLGGQRPARGPAGRAPVSGRPRRLLDRHGHRLARPPRPGGSARAGAGPWGEPTVRPAAGDLEGPDRRRPGRAGHQGRGLLRLRGPQPVRSAAGAPGGDRSPVPLRGGSGPDRPDGSGPGRGRGQVVRGCPAEHSAPGSAEHRTTRCRGPGTRMTVASGFRARSRVSQLLSLGIG